MPIRMVVPLRQQRRHEPECLNFLAHAHQVVLFLPQYLVHILHDEQRTSAGWQTEFAILAGLRPAAGWKHCNAKHLGCNVKKTGFATPLAP
jgi:hypothetical protein